ncbi:Rieske (2Fe-2S) protein [Actinotalea sp. BY-33]|uniref:Cytochrome bc1 complex Rieske iron-sulfur subunit n=1 Tax=Actinotalea soli TaxID=2819234 RepID=A0A939LNQ3_9CELL|nr:Rieske (2Fe-2S) protein [Actinotalea soli]MBO1751842.1 Rieske (2Fe-2S) protein [Actinotalea soli]
MSPALNRREALAVSGMVVGVGALAACARGGPGPAAPDPDAPTASGALVALDAVPIGGAVVVTGSAGGPVVVSRTGQDDVVGLSGVCTHQGCTVAAEGEELVCPCHQSVFDPATGENLEGPATEPLATIELRLEDGQVYEA